MVLVLDTKQVLMLSDALTQYLANSEELDDKELDGLHATDSLAEAQTMLDQVNATLAGMAEGGFDGRDS